MRGLLLWCMLALAIVAGAEDVSTALVAGAEDGSPAIEEEVDILDDPDARINVARALEDLFTWDDEDDDEHNLEDGTMDGINREARLKTEEEESEVESKAVVAPEDQARYNKFMDTFYRRLNADARSTIDPIDIPLIKKKPRKGNPKGAKGKKGKKGPKPDDKGKGKKKKKNTKKGNKKTNNKKTKKTGRHPKSLDLEGEVDESNGHTVPEGEADKEVHHVVTREVVEEAEEVSLEARDGGIELEGRSADADKDEDPASRRIPVKKEKKDKKDKKKTAKSNKNKKKKKGNKKNNNKNNKSKRSTNKKPKKNGKSSKGKKGPQTSRASVAGIATLTRVGDVIVVNRKDGKELRSGFKLGPVSLKVNRKYGNGKDAVVRTASASSPELTGRMHLYVASDGKAKITKFNIVKPSVVHTDGTLSKDQNKQRAETNNFMENSIGRITPLAAKKLKLAARDVLQATESKN